MSNKQTSLGPSRIRNQFYEPSSWSYQYAPYQSVAEGTEIPAFEILGDDGEKIADTNEGLPRDEQERHAKLIASAPQLVGQIEAFIELITAHLVHGEVSSEAFDEEESKGAALIRSACLIGAPRKSKAP